MPDAGNTLPQTGVNTDGSVCWDFTTSVQCVSAATGYNDEVAVGKEIVVDGGVFPGDLIFLKNDVTVAVSETRGKWSARNNNTWLGIEADMILLEGKSRACRNVGSAMDAGDDVLKSEDRQLVEIDAARQ